MRCGCELKLKSVTWGSDQTQTNFTSLQAQVKSGRRRRRVRRRLGLGLKVGWEEKGGGGCLVRLEVFGSNGECTSVQRGL